jgi:hypothetical protein
MNDIPQWSLIQQPSRHFGALWRLPVLLLLALPAGMQAQFTYTTINHTITITGYTGPGGQVTIPNTLNGMPVTSIGDSAFQFQTTVTSVTIPNSVTSIGYYAFNFCAGLTSVTIPSSVTNIGNTPFIGCGSLSAITVDANSSSYTSVEGVLFDKNQTALIECPGALAGSYVVPNGVTSIGHEAFAHCTSLADIIVPSSVTNIFNGAFAWCPSLTGIYFTGNAPTLVMWAPLRGWFVFEDDTNATVYYVAGISGWGTAYGGVPTAPWARPLILNNSPGFGVLTNRFGFIISWAPNMAVVVEACINPANPAWTPVSTNTLLSSGSSYFSDPEWTSFRARFYRLRSQ